MRAAHLFGLALLALFTLVPLACDDDGVSSGNSEACVTGHCENNCDADESSCSMDCSGDSTCSATCHEGQSCSFACSGDAVCEFDCTEQECAASGTNMDNCTCTGNCTGTCGGISGLPSGGGSEIPGGGNIPGL